MPRPPRPWFRFYSEMLENRKVQRLKPPLFKHWVNLMALANLSQRRGYLPPIEDIAFRLRLSEEAVSQVIEELLALRLLDEDDDGYAMHDWIEWQPDSDANLTPARATRAQRTRNERGMNALHTGNERIEKEEEKDREEDKDVEGEEERTRAPEHPFALMFSQEHQRRHAGRPPSPIQHGEALALEKEFGADACIQVARELDWQKPPAYMRPRLEERRDKRQQPKPDLSSSPFAAYG